jgi:hypothetical protein
MVIGVTKLNEKEDKMRLKELVIIFCMLLVVGCVKSKPVTVPPPLADPCPMPTGYKLEPAIEMAEQTVTNCPDKLDQVFFKLLEIAKHSPGKGNGILIQDLLKELIKTNRVSETYTKNLYQKYFSRRFVSMPDIKVYNLAGEMSTIKKGLKKELALKKMGMVECCNDKEAYKHAEAEYARAINFMENLVHNEEYLKESG